MCSEHSLDPADSVDDHKRIEFETFPLRFYSFQSKVSIQNLLSNSLRNEWFQTTWQFSSRIEVML